MILFAFTTPRQSSKRPRSGRGRACRCGGPFCWRTFGDMAGIARTFGWTSFQARTSFAALLQHQTFCFCFWLVFLKTLWDFCGLVLHWICLDKQDDYQWRQAQVPKRRELLPLQHELLQPKNFGKWIAPEEKQAVSKGPNMSKQLLRRSLPLKPPQFTPSEGRCFNLIFRWSDPLISMISWSKELHPKLVVSQAGVLDLQGA